MIKVDKKCCCGCTACEQICPRKCISMYEDSEGFLYPKINKTNCIDCGLCEKVCPYHVLQINRKVHKAYAFKHNDINIHKNSSSGGAFSAIAYDIIINGGIVYGAAFDTNFNVITSKIEKIEDLYKLRGSKYVQSIMSDTMNDIKSELKKGKQVLFCGTPCQVKALHGFLLRKYQNLTTIDFACHAIPSPKVWKSYLNFVRKRNSVSIVNFRNKDIAGWNNYALEIICKINNESKLVIGEGNRDNLYMKGFLENLYNRPSCSNCPARNFTSLSDVTIADFWNVEKYHNEKEFNKNDGISLLISYDDKSDEIINHLKEHGFMMQVDIDEIEPNKVHSCLTKSIKHHELRNFFFLLFKIGIPIKICINTSLKIKKIIKALLNKK